MRRSVDNKNSKGTIVKKRELRLPFDEKNKKV